MTVRDDTGAVIATATLPSALGTASPAAFAANGHISFLLTQAFPQTAGIRGTIEFDAPSGTTIGALGIRSPLALTFTTLPAVAK